MHVFSLHQSFKPRLAQTCWLDNNSEVFSIQALNKPVSQMPADPSAARQQWQDYSRPATGTVLSSAARTGGRRCSPRATPVSSRECWSWLACCKIGVLLGPQRRVLCHTGSTSQATWKELFELIFIWEQGKKNAFLIKRPFFFRKIPRKEGSWAQKL